jgi:hypothetical protein
MTLGELAFSCYIFSKIDNGQCEEFRKKVNSLKFIERDDYHKLLVLLNKYWKCRLPKKSLEDLAKKLESWHNKYRSRLFSEKKYLSELNDKDLSLAAEAYGDLFKCKVKYDIANNESNKKLFMSFGPTVAAKILFALRPNALPPWDKAIREELLNEDLINGDQQELYLSYLKHIQKVICKLQKTYGETLQNWSHKLNKSLSKLIDEYYWITKTRNIHPPTKDVLQHWAKWSE